MTPETPAAASPRQPFLRLRKPVSRAQALASALAIWGLFFGVWVFVSSTGMVKALLVPAPQQVFATSFELFFARGFGSDVLISIGRVLAAFGMAAAVAVPLGVMMGSFPAIEAIFAPFVSAWRYLPAPSFIPILLMWFGTGEAPKLALLFIGVIFFLITLIMDHTKTVREELVETALTLGAGRATVVAQVIFPAVLPDIMVAMRTFARELAPLVLVNAIAPGSVETDMTSPASMSPAQLARDLDTPLARFGQPEEIAAMAAWLAGPESSFVTGQCLGVNGGSVMT